MSCPWCEGDHPDNPDDCPEMKDLVWCVVITLGFVPSGYQSLLGVYKTHALATKALSLWVETWDTSPGLMEEWGRRLSRGEGYVVYGKAEARVLGMMVKKSASREEGW